jgi:hypothetical protein
VNGNARDIRSARPARLRSAGADPNSDTDGEAPETPLHWAASSDSLDVADALIDARR